MRRREVAPPSSSDDLDSAEPLRRFASCSAENVSVPRNVTGKRYTVLRHMNIILFILNI